MPLRFRIIFLAVLIFAALIGVSRAEDCGLRGYDGGTEIIKFDCEDVAIAKPSALRVALPTDGSIRSIKLVDLADSTASKFRVRYKDTSVSPNVDVIKAIGKILPGITSCEELQMIGYHPAYPLNGTYALGSKIDCSATNPANWTNPKYAGQLWEVGFKVRFPKGFNDVASSKDKDLATTLGTSALGAKGWLPIPYSFSGILNGRGYVIGNLYINRPDNGSSLPDPGTHHGGLFSLMKGGQVNDLGLENVDIAVGGTCVGGLAGQAVDSSQITNVYVTGRVSGGSYVGGLVGSVGDSSTITSCHATSSVTSTGSPAGAKVGGLVGNFYSLSSIKNSYATGNLRGSHDMGGLVGSMGDSSISRSRATGSVTGTHYLGGFVGTASSSLISDSYATGVTNGTSGSVGGFAGVMNRVSVTNSYATGSVSGTSPVGGFVGNVASTSSGSVVASIANSYSTGIASGTGEVGGFVGNLNTSAPSPVFKNCWWYNGTNSAYGVGTAIAPVSGIKKAGAADNFFQAGSPTGGAVYTSSTAPWDFTNTWKSVSGALPRLKWES